LGLRKILASLLSVSLSFGLTVYWKDKTLELKVPKNSVVVIELPCTVLRTFFNDYVQAKASGNGVFVSVMESPTSVGVSCKRGNVYRNYSFYLFPTNGGVTYVKVLDPKLDEAYKTYVISKEREKEIETKSGILQRAEKLMQSILKGKIPQGYEVIKSQEKRKIGNLLLKTEYLYVGNGIIGIVGKIKNLSYMQKKISSDTFFEKGTILVWIEKEGWFRPNEEVSFVVIKKLGKEKEAEELVIPYKKGG